MKTNTHAVTPTLIEWALMLSRAGKSGQELPPFQGSLRAYEAALRRLSSSGLAVVAPPPARPDGQRWKITPAGKQFVQRLLATPLE